MHYIDDSKCLLCYCLWDHTRHLSKIDFECTGERIGDGFCNDNCNVEEFQYDDKDCCTDFIRSEQCIDCVCHFDGIRHSDEYECSTHRIGNHRCEDECNTEYFDYDQFDCCTLHINKDYCSECVCHLTGFQHQSM